MRSLRMLAVGVVIGLTIMFIVLSGGENAYVQRRPTDRTTNDDLTRWIEQDNCRPQTVGDRVIYYRCPRFRW